ncbi:unnamed protein product [Penicillium salamii]|uniref:Nucleoside phosphorylase domain-containing protein n=1 Tax=Penicillium salamii TaxID=1612424 RepID=A0A9W4JU93_9EURO|nr:unnamed protein product [Penicillium salamii]CAG8414947.1 unnamed protein product [Penicillium salamii]CAG8420187.1 unnamed protein product [Penicillium salamii]
MADPKAYAIGWICAIITEYTAAKQFLDEVHEEPESLSANDNNAYTLGKIGKHNVVIAVLPDGEYGLSSAARVAGSLLHSFPNVKIGLMVGIGGGAPSAKRDIRLGDVVVSSPRDGKGGVFQYDFGKSLQEKSFQQTGFLNQPPEALRAAVIQLRSQYESDGHEFEQTINAILEKKKKLRKNYKRPSPSNDRLYQSMFVHKADGENCSVACGDAVSHLVPRQQRDEDEDDPAIHYGLIASANTLMKDASIRDKLSAEMGVLCFEMEAAGLMNHFPCLVIRGICDYADSHKNKEWQGYAAMTATCYAKDLLSRLTVANVQKEKKIIELLSDIGANTSKTESDVSNLKSTLTSWGDRQMLDWLTKFDYGPQQSDHLSRRQPGTGTWFLESTQYKNWRDSDGQILFCPGMPGAGKTILTSIVIEDLTARCSIDPAVGLAYVFCNFRLKDQQSAEHMLASILKQLAQRQSPLPESVKSLYECHEPARTRPSLEELSKCVQSVMATYRTVFLVIDALDECQKLNDCQNIFIGHLVEIQRTSHSKMLVTSRPIPEIAERFRGEELKIRARESDVESYLYGRISQAGSEILKLHKQEIATKITECVDGMFLLAQLHFDTIKSKLTPRAVKDSLSTLRSGIEAYTQAYDDAMERIKAQNRDASNLAMEILKWITHAKRQLNIRELCEALAVKLGSRELDRDNIPVIKDMVSVCAGLVTVDMESDSIHLVHYTTQDYFETNQGSWFTDAELMLAKTCLTYLCFDVFDSGVCRSYTELRDRRLHHALYTYSAKNWGLHARGTEIELARLIHEFLGNTRKVSASAQALPKLRWPRSYGNPWSYRRLNRSSSFSHWASESDESGVEVTAVSLGLSDDGTDWTHFDGTPGEPGSLNGVSLPDRLPHDAVSDISSQTTSFNPRAIRGLHLAAHFGLSETVDHLLESEQSPDVTDSDGYTPLHWAFGAHQIIVAQKLLDKGANWECRDPEENRTPLSLAAEDGFVDIIELLLNNGADVESRDETGRTPLSWAVENGHLNVTELLLENGANTESQDKTGRIILSWAVKGGFVDIIELLIKNGTKLESRDQSGRTSFSWAVENRFLDTIQLLLNNGAELESRDETGRTPLFRAAENGHLDVMELLFENGANTESQDKTGRIILSWAVKGGFVDIIELLIKNGTKLESRDQSGRTSFSWAAEYGFWGSIELLINNGANVESRDETGRTPLSWAVKCRDGLNVEIFLEKGANVESRDESGRTPLSWAVENGPLDTIQLLLSERADLESRDGTGRTPLSWAAKNGSLNAVEFLVKKGANVESQDESGRTPLSWAVECGSRSRVESRDEAGQTAISWETATGYRAVVDLLLNKGARMDSRDDSGRTPLDWCEDITEKEYWAQCQIPDSMGLPGRWLRRKSFEDGSNAITPVIENF